MNEDNILDAKATNVMLTLPDSKFIAILGVLIKSLAKRCCKRITTIFTLQVVWY